MKKTVLFLILCMLTFSLAACSKGPDYRTATETANIFMKALKQNDNETSWRLLTQGQQDAYGNTAAWADYTLPRHFEQWNFTSITIDNGTAQISGEAMLGIDPYLVTLILEESAEGWLVSDIEFSLK